MVKDANILIIHKENSLIEDIRRALSSFNYNIKSENSYILGLNFIHKAPFDVIFIQWQVDDCNAEEMVRAIKEIEPQTMIIFLVDSLSPELFLEICRINIYDYLSLPPDYNRLIFLTKKAIQEKYTLSHLERTDIAIKEQNLSLQKQNILLAKRIESSTKNLANLYDNLRQTYLRTIKAFAQAIEARNYFTHRHSENVSKYAVIIGEEMSLPQKDIEIIKEACQLHDLGKIAISDSILSKPGKLTTEERKEIELHTIKAVQILEPLTFLGKSIDLIKYHHEHFDGRGYPEGLKGENIPLGSRIICIADSFDAMTSARSYRNIPLTKEEAIEEIKKESGSHFDPKITEVFLKVVDRFGI